MSPARHFGGLLALLAIGTTLVPSPAAHARTDDLEVVAGTGVSGSTGDGGPATNALLNHPSGVATAGDGTVYVSDTGNRTVRAISPAGSITTVAGTGRAGTPGSVPSGIRGTEFDLTMPATLSMGPGSTLYIVDKGQFRIFALAQDGRLSVVAGTGRQGDARDGTRATEAALGQIGGLAVAADGTVYLGDLDNHRVRAITPNGLISTVAGNGGTQVTAAGGPAASVPVPHPASLAVDREGAVWIGSGLLVHRLSEGRLATVVLPGEIAANRWGLAEDTAWPPSQTPLNNIAAVAAGSDGVYVLDQQSRSVLRLGAGDAVNDIASLETTGNPAAGPIAVSASGTTYFVDNTGHRVYAFHPQAAPQSEGDEQIAKWPFVAGGIAVIILVLAGGRVALRRRQAG